MKALLSCLLITIIVIMLIGIVSVLKNSEQLSKRAFWSVLLIFAMVEILCILCVKKHSPHFCRKCCMGHPYQLTDTLLLFTKG